jgi:hypothetical protein
MQAFRFWIVLDYRRQRIGAVGALANLGYEVCDQTVGNALQRHVLRGARAQARDILVGFHSDPSGAAGGERLLHRGGADITRADKLLRAVFIHLESRRVDIAGITVYPDEPWKQIASEEGSFCGQ